MKINFKPFIALTLVCGILATITSCEKKESPEPTEGAYSLGTIVDEVSYVLSSEKLTEGTVSPVGNGVEFGTAEFIQSGEYIYFFSRDDKKLYQYQLNLDGSVTEVASLLLTAYITDRAYSQNLVEDHTILILDPVTWGDPEVKWLTVSIPDFVITASGTTTLPSLEKTPGVDWNVNVGRGVVRNGKFYMGTILYDFDGNYPDGSHVIVFDYPSMTNPTLIATTQTDAELGIFTNTSFAMADNGDIYIAGYRGFYGKPSDDNVNGVLFRIKNGETDFDQGYLLDFTAANGEPTQVMQLDYIGGGKAMAMLFNPTELTAWADLDGEFFYWGIVDLASGTVTRTDVPKSACRLARRPLITENMYYTYLKNASTNVIGIDLSSGTYSTGTLIEGSNVDGYSIAQHPSE